jgi:NDP-sugar pyrophosphorylase family protein
MRFNLLILGAGRGTRLSPLTDVLPKPLLTIDNSETILLRMVKQFRKLIPISNIWVNVSTHPEIFLNYLSGLDSEFRPQVLFEPNLLGSANTIFELSKVHNSPTLVIHGDLILSNEYVNSLFEVISRDPEFVVFCHSRSSDSARSQITINNSNIVKSLVNKSVNSVVDSNVLVNSGIYFFPNLKQIGLAPEIGIEIADSILQTLIRFSKLLAFEIKEERVAVDSFKQLEEARNLVKKERLRS